MLRTFRWFFVVLAGAVFAALPARSDAAVFLSVGFSIDTPPPPIVAYEQPQVPEANYVWEPGFWALGDAGYYWVPGTWVLPPDPDLYWTPPYWGYNNGNYAFYNGYWAPQVGFYGGIDYGFGYFGNGFVGGMWNGPNFNYNAAYANVGGAVVIANIYRRTVINIYNGPRYSYNGPGGFRTRPTAAQLAVMRGHRVPATAAQLQHIRLAAANRNYLATVNGGRPGIAAVARPLSASNRPNYAAVTSHDRNVAQMHLKRAGAAVSVSHAAPAVHHAAKTLTVRHSYTQHTQPVPVHHTYAQPPVHHTYTQPRPQRMYTQPHPVQHPASHPASHPQQPHPQGGQKPPEQHPQGQHPPM